MISRLVARHRLLGRVGIWYHPEYSPGPERILIELIDEGLLSASDVRRAPIASVGDLLRFHALSHLEAAADRKLRAERREAGGTIEAALAAVKSGRMCAINLGGGLRGVIDDVGIASAKLRAQGFDRPIAFIDEASDMPEEEPRPGLIFYRSARILERDIFVLDLAARLKAPIVVMRPEAHLIRYALTGRREIKTPTKRDLRAEFSRIAREIDPMDLIEDSLELTDEEILASLDRRGESHRILGYYSAEGVEFALERYGLLPEIRKRGWAELALDIDPSDPTHQLLRVRGRKRARVPMSTLVEMVVSRRSFELPDGNPERCASLHIEWMLLEDPSKSFTPARPPLPGQKHPGLGLARQAQELLLQAAIRLGLSAVSDNPAHYHNAFGARADFFFVDPEVEGRFRAMVDALEGMAIAEASFLVEEGRLQHAGGSILTWTPALHVLPIDERTRAYFGSEAYRSAVEAARKVELRIT